MKLRQLKSEIKETISNGSLENSLDVIETFCSNLPDDTLLNQGDVIRAIAHLKGRYSQYKKSKNRGILSYDQTEQIYNKLIYDTLEIVDGIKLLSEVDPSIRNTKEDSQGLFSQRRFFIFVGIFVTIILGFLWIGLIRNDQELDLSEKTSSPTILKYHDYAIDCYVTTGVVAELHERPTQTLSSRIAILPMSKRYKATRRAIVSNAIKESFFYIETEKYGDGWVRQSELEYVELDCRLE